MNKLSLQSTSKKEHQTTTQTQALALVIFGYASSCKVKTPVCAQIYNERVDFDQF